jgi:hypothetical protein
MSVLLLRVVFSALLLATVSVGLLPSEKTDGNAGVRAAIVRVLTVQGLSVQAYPAARLEDALAPVLFAAPGCQGMLQVITVSLSLQEAPMLEAYLEPTFKRRYVYLGRIWFAADPFAMRVEWVKYKALAILGLRRHAMPKTALVVAEPQDCHAVEQIDWRPVWSPHKAEKT